MWSDDRVEWCEENSGIRKMMKKETHGYELLQGTGAVRGHLLGGCIDVFMMCIGTEIWPSPGQWRDALLFIETSEDRPSPDFIRWMLRNLAAQGILRELRGILVGKPQGETYYEEYKEAILQVIAGEEHLTQLPILYNMNFGHAMPIGILPYGLRAELNCEKKTVTFLESAVI